MISLKKKAGLGLVAAAAIGSLPLSPWPAAHRPAPIPSSTPTRSSGSVPTRSRMSPTHSPASAKAWTSRRCAPTTASRSSPGMRSPPTAASPPRSGTGQILRPNGSTNGSRALSATVGGTQWPLSGTLCGGPRAMGGIVDFARSSSGPTSVTYWPAPVHPGIQGRPVVRLSASRREARGRPTSRPLELIALHATGPQIDRRCPGHRLRYPDRVGHVRIVDGQSRLGHATARVTRARTSATTSERPAACRRTTVLTSSPRAHSLRPWKATDLRRHRRWRRGALHQRAAHRRLLGQPVHRPR